LSVKRQHSLLGVVNVKLAYMLVVYVQMSDFHLINVFCVVIVVKKCTMASPGGLLEFRTAQQKDTIWCLRTKLHIYAACCSDTKMEL